MPEPRSGSAGGVNLTQAPGADASHPAFYLPAQELLAGNPRGFWVLDPCEPDGSSCMTGDQCCNGYCEAEDGALVCSNTSRRTACARCRATSARPPPIAAPRATSASAASARSPARPEGRARSHDSPSRSHDSAERSHDSAERSHDSAERSHDSAERSHDSAERSHDSAERSRASRSCSSPAGPRTAYLVSPKTLNMSKARRP